MHPFAVSCQIGLQYDYVRLLHLLFLPHLGATNKKIISWVLWWKIRALKTPQFFILVNLHLSPTLSNSPHNT